MQQNVTATSPDVCADGRQCHLWWYELVVAVELEVVFCRHGCSGVLSGLNTFGNVA